MNSSDFGWMVLMICIFTLGWIGGVEAGKLCVQKEAVQHGYAEYNSTSGDCQWKTNNFYIAK